MKFNIRHFALIAMAILFGGPFSFAENRNTWLTAQAFGIMDASNIPQVEYLKLAHWADTKVRQLRLTDAEDKTGAYQSLFQFDTEGNLTRVEMPAEKVTLLFSYTNAGMLRKIDAMEKAVKVGQFNYYYDKMGMLSRATYDDFGDNTQVEIWYDKYDNPIMQHLFARGELKNQFEIQNTYNGMGKLSAQKWGNNSSELIYNAENQLIQVRRTVDGKSFQTDFVYNNGKVTEVKSYKLAGDHYGLASTLSLQYDKEGRLNRETVSYPDPAVMGLDRTYNYDETWQELTAHRGEEAWTTNFGYGTPVVIKWVTPEKDLKVVDSMVTLKMDLKPGVSQKMPEIVNITLRQNGKKTERKIGNVVLRKRGKGDEYYIEETLPMFSGANELQLEVETQLGRFSSDERFITFRDPNALVRSRNVHVLAIGISDYEAEGLDIRFGDADAMDFSKAIKAAGEGKMFEKVEVKTLTNAEATRENILAAVKELKGKTAEEDLAIVYFSGQGESFDGKYFLRTYDSGKDYVSLEVTGIDTKWLAEELNSFRSPVAGFFDASQHTEKGVTPSATLSTEVGIIKDNFKEIVADDEMVRTILISAQGTQKSLESGEWSNGLFTETLLEALSGSADQFGNRDGVITFDEVTSYVKSEVKDRSEYKQAPTSFEAGIGKLAVGKK